MVYFNRTIVPSGKRFGKVTIHLNLWSLLWNMSIYVFCSPMPVTFAHFCHQIHNRAKIESRCVKPILAMPGFQKWLSPPDKMLYLFVFQNCSRNCFMWHVISGRGALMQWCPNLTSYSSSPTSPLLVLLVIPPMLLIKLAAMGELCGKLGQTRPTHALAKLH